MPNYTFLNTETNEHVTVFLKMSEYDDFVKDHPNFVRVFKPNGFVDPIRAGITKPDQGFRDLLRRIKSKHRGSTLDVS